jgi:hypothetical protein
MTMQHISTASTTQPRQHSERITHVRTKQHSALSFIRQFSHVLSLIMFLAIAFNGELLAQSPEQWIKDAGVRVDVGSGADPDSARAANPDVFQLPDGRYRMYYTGHVNPIGSATSILSAVSTDGLVWSKESGVRLSVGGGAVRGDGAAFDDGQVEEPSVIRLDTGEYWMYYGAIGNSTARRVILRASSPDGLTWTKDPSFYITGEQPTIPDTHVGGQLIVRDLGGYRMYFNNYNTGSASQSSVMLATSVDGLAWTIIPGHVLTGNDVTGTFVYSSGIREVATGIQRLYFSAGSPERIYSATSLDGGFSWAIDPGLRLDFGGPGDYDYTRLTSGTVNRVGDATILYYTGRGPDGSDTHRILSARLDQPVTPTITWLDPASITYGTALTSTQLNASASVPGSFSYSPSVGIVLNAGSAQTLSVTFTPDDILHNTSASASVHISVVPASLSVSADSVSRFFGTPNPVLTGTIVGLANGDAISATFVSTATIDSPAGSYSITPVISDPGGRLPNYLLVSTNGTLTILPATSFGSTQLWVGLKNSDDQGTRFDVRLEVSKNGSLVTSGLVRCVDNVTRNADAAVQLSIVPEQFGSVRYDSGDVLAIKVLTRIGTNPDETKCSGHNNAVGLRLYYDAVSRQSRFGVTFDANPAVNFFLHTNGSSNLLNTIAPVATTANFKDSAAVNYAGGNPWKDIATWSVTIP